MMELTQFSLKRFDASLDQWEVDAEWKDVVRNYLIHGIEPGSFFTCLFANDLMMAVIHSHSANTVTALKKLCCWITAQRPHQETFWGSYENVQAWLHKTPAQRRRILEQMGLVYTEFEEFNMAMKS